MKIQELRVYAPAAQHTSIVICWKKKNAALITGDIVHSMETDIIVIEKYLQDVKASQSSIAPALEFFLVMQLL